MKALIDGATIRLPGIQDHHAAVLGMCTHPSRADPLSKCCVLMRWPQQHKQGGRCTNHAGSDGSSHHSARLFQPAQQVLNSGEGNLYRCSEMPLHVALVTTCMHQRMTSGGKL